MNRRKPFFIATAFPVDSFERLEDILRENNTPEKILEMNEERLAVFQKLSVRQQIVFLALEYGFNHKEIADSFKINVRRIKRIMSEIATVWENTAN